MTKHVVTASIFDKRGRLLSKAQNDYTRSHPVQASFARKAGMPARIYLHAEIAALVKLRPRDRPTHIHITRTTKTGQLALAAPCPVCVAALQHWGINEVTFSL